MESKREANQIKFDIFHFSNKLSFIFVVQLVWLKLSCSNFKESVRRLGKNFQFFFSFFFFFFFKYILIDIFFFSDTIVSKFYPSFLYSNNYFTDYFIDSYINNSNYFIKDALSSLWIFPEALQDIWKLSRQYYVYWWWNIVLSFILILEFLGARSFPHRSSLFTYINALLSLPFNSNNCYAYYL